MLCNRSQQSWRLIIFINKIRKRKQICGYQRVRNGVRGGELDEGNQKIQTFQFMR